MNSGMSKYYELTKILEHAKAKAQAGKEREKTELEAEQQEATKLAHQLVIGMVAYFEFPEQQVHYFNAKRRQATDLSKPPPIYREWYGCWELGVEMDWPRCRIQIGLTFKKDNGGFQVAIGRAGEPRFFPGSDPQDLYEEIAEKIQQAFESDPQRDQLQIGL